MSSAIPIITYLCLSNLLTQLICARTKSPQKCLFLFRKASNIPVLFSICLSKYILTSPMIVSQNPGDGSKFNDREV